VNTNAQTEAHPYKAWVCRITEDCYQFKAAASPKEEVAAWDEALTLAQATKCIPLSDVYRILQSVLPKDPALGRLQELAVDGSVPLAKFGEQHSIDKAKVDLLFKGAGSQLA
jgi:hypothetical protein